MMKLASMFSALTLTGSLLCISALAQTRVCLGGDLPHLTKAQKESCAAKIQTVRSMAASLHAPADWHFVVVCGEDGWKQYAAYSMRAEGDLENLSADTDFTQHETFLRESALGDTSLAGPGNIMARQVAEILSRVSVQTSTAL